MLHASGEGHTRGDDGSFARLGCRQAKQRSRRKSGEHIQSKQASPPPRFCLERSEGRTGTPRALPRGCPERQNRRTPRPRNDPWRQRLAATAALEAQRLNSDGGAGCCGSWRSGAENRPKPLPWPLLSLRDRCPRGAMVCRALALRCLLVRHFSIRGLALFRTFVAQGLLGIQLALSRCTADLFMRPMLATVSPSLPRKVVAGGCRQPRERLSHWQNRSSSEPIGRSKLPAPSPYKARGYVLTEDCGARRDQPLGIVSARMLGARERRITANV